MQVSKLGTQQSQVEEPKTSPEEKKETSTIQNLAKAEFQNHTLLYLTIKG